MTEDSAVLRTIQQQNWLEPIEQGLKQGLDEAFKPDDEAGKPIANTLHGVWLGHPLHPVLTDIPIGSWTVSCVLDLIEEVSGSRKYRAGSDAALAIGIAGAAASAVAGVTDWKDISQEARRAGLVHGLLNTAALALYVASAAQRASGKRGGARIAAYAGFAVTMASAWLGGHLVFADQIGVERTSGTTPPDAWTAVAALSDVPEGTPFKAEHEGYHLLLVKKGDKIYALANECTHLGAPLSEGKLEGDCIRCPWHGSLFSLEDGSVKESPAVRPIRQFETRVRGGQVEVRVR